MPDSPSESLAQTYERLWSCLESGVSAQRSPFTMLQAATLGVDGALKVRTIVRQVNRADRVLSFHTDARSEKVAELRRDPRIALVANDLDAPCRFAWKVRHRSATTKRNGARSGKRAVRIRCCCIAHRCRRYAGRVAGSRAGPGEPGAASTDDGYGNFCLLHVTVTRIDWLELARTGHRRAVFDLHERGYEGRWVAP